VRTWQVAYRGQLPDDFLDELTSTIPQRTQFWDRAIRAAPERHQHQLVAIDDGVVVGFVTYGPPDTASVPGAGELYAIYLDPSHWGRGYGRALMRAAERGLAEAGFSKAYLWVLETNARARRFYEIAGWRADGETKVDHRGGRRASRGALPPYAPPVHTRRQTVTRRDQHPALDHLGSLVGA
jgi:ribosomal protein S18 acetylase RimI-like enzyme